jgi:hypothetical protein
MDNQRIIQSTPAIFSFKPWTKDDGITVEKVRAPNAGRRSGPPKMYWPHIWWLNHAVKGGVDCNERWFYTALIIHRVDCSVAESHSNYPGAPSFYSYVMLRKTVSCYQSHLHEFRSGIFSARRGAMFWNKCSLYSFCDWQLVIVGKDLEETKSMVKGTVQRKLTWVKSGINRQLMIWQPVAWYLF